MSRPDVLNRIAAANPVSSASGPPASAWDATVLFAEIDERRQQMTKLDERTEMVPQTPRRSPWRRIAAAAGAFAVVLALVGVVAFVAGRDRGEEVVEPTTTSTAPTTAPPTTVTTTTEVPPTTGAPTTSAAPTTTVSPEEAAFLEIPSWVSYFGTEGGEFRSIRFLAPVSFTVGDGWRRVDTELELEKAMTPMAIPSGVVAVWMFAHDETPEELLARINSSEQLEVLDSAPTTIGGVAGTRVSFRGIGESEFVFAQPNRTTDFRIFAGEAATAHILEVGGNTISVLVFSPSGTGRLSAIEAEAQPVLDSITWWDFGV